MTFLSNAESRTLDALRKEKHKGGKSGYDHISQTTLDKLADMYKSGNCGYKSVAAACDVSHYAARMYLTAIGAMRGRYKAVSTQEYREVYKCSCEGMTYAQIAHRMNISIRRVQTIKTHIKNGYAPGFGDEERQI